MKTHTTPRQPLRPLTDADRAMILALAAQHSVGLEERCARYRHRVRLFRTAVAVCVVVLVSATAGSAYAQPQVHTASTLYGAIDTAHAYKAVHTVIYRPEAV